ncbi:transposase, partial [Streptococcus pneumoniae]
KQLIRKIHMELLHFITKLLDIEDTDIKIINVINRVTHKEIIAKLEATNNLIKLIKRNAFGFRNFENFKKQIFIALNIKKERTKFVLSLA